MNIKMNKFRKKIVLIITIIQIVFHSNQFVLAQHFDNLVSLPDLKGYQSVYLPTGSFIRGVLQYNISTEFNRPGDPVRILNPSDIYLKEMVVIPKGSVFAGNISELQKPVQGRNGYMKIVITHVIKPNGQIIPMQGHVWTSNKDSIIGGEITPKSSTKGIVHYLDNIKQPILQEVPAGPRVLGSNTLLTAGSYITIMLDQNLNLELLVD